MVIYRPGVGRIYSGRESFFRQSSGPSPDPYEGTSGVVTSSIVLANGITVESYGATYKPQGYPPLAPGQEEVAPEATPPHAQTAKPKLERNWRDGCGLAREG
ncbi:hypothetical protein M2334_002129 [Sphingobium sp. B11D3D]|nr:hypothetical protein [Sphingobium sp. B11D3D]